MCTITQKLKINRLLPKISPGLERRFEKLPGITQVDSLISNVDTIVGNKCQIKRSIIGKRCTIDPGSKIDNSLLMERINVQAG